MKGISTWLFSKMSMLVFLIITFSTITAFSLLIKEKMYSDSAAVAAETMKDHVQSAVFSGALEVSSLKPLSKTIPEERGRTYSVYFQHSGDYLSIAVGWGENPKGYTAASILYVPQGLTVCLKENSAAQCSDEVSFYSDKIHYVKVIKKGSTLEIVGCESKAC